MSAKPIIDAVGKRVRFRPHFQAREATEEGTLVAYADRPQCIIRMDDGTTTTVDATLVWYVARTEWDAVG